jgi:hypothetical protein
LSESRKVEEGHGYLGSIEIERWEVLSLRKEGEVVFECDGDEKVRKEEERERTREGRPGFIVVLNSHFRHVTRYRSSLVSRLFSRSKLQVSLLFSSSLFSPGLCIGVTLGLGRGDIDAYVRRDKRRRKAKTRERENECMQFSFSDYNTRG